MEFAVLGPLHVSADAQPLPLGGGKQRTLLAELICHAGRAVSRSILIEALWGQTPPRTAADNLRLYVHQLRRTLGGDRITRTSAGYGLSIRPEELDADRFETLAEQGRAALAAGDHERAAALLRRSLELWRGPAYAELNLTAGLRDHAHRLEEVRLTALENRIEADLARGMHAALIAELSGLVAEHPLRDRPRTQLMLALARSGRQAEALATYQDARRLFAAELGLDPGAELRHLHQAILTGTLPVDTSTTPSGDISPAQLPTGISDFTGREDQLAQLTGLLGKEPPPGPGPVRVCVITGMGGVGKTTLAVHAAHRIARHYPDGQLHANLHGAEACPSDPTQVLAAFLTALGTPRSTLPETTEERAAFFRSRLAERRMLIVLDNAASEEQVRPLLPGTSGCAVIITSRIRLTGLSGAPLIELSVLPPKQAVQLLSRIAGAGRVAAEAKAAAEIVRLSDCIPLAVRVAGARLAARPHWPLTHLARQLTDERRRLDRFTTGDLAVRASLALSYVGLDHETCRAFRLLGSLDVPDFAGWVAGALLDLPVAAGEELVEALVDAQLVLISGTDPAGQPRYRFHDLVRLYARERSELEDEPEIVAAALGRAFGAWLALAEHATQKVPGTSSAIIHGTAPRWSSPDETPWEGLAEQDPMAWFDTERPALVASIRQACSLGLAEVAWDMACCVERYFDVCGQFDDWRALHEGVLDACRRAGNRLGEAMILRGLMHATTWMETGGEAMAAQFDGAEQLIAMFSELGERRGLSDAYVLRAWGEAARGDMTQGLRSGRIALSLAEGSGHLGGEARAHVCMAVAYGTRQIRMAIVHLLRGLELAEKLGNPRFEATALQFLGLAHAHAREFEAGLQYLSRALAIYRQFRDPLLEAMGLVALAKLYAVHHDPRARAAAEAAEALSRSHHLAHHTADALWVLGEVDLAEGRISEAVTHLEESVRLWRTRGWQEFLAGALASLADAYTAAGDLAAAAQACREAGALAGIHTDQMRQPTQSR
ncbi:BTAD domain-containing putative transcriptional regulator [Microtetraspora sp. NBRC 16547]|uniref:AfsR/SARP family transcriptional regulator n=1 Tax=Microtetraspora sp. NBRC 16547 TaxID=3030993 RepID=UPI0024A12C52|nr:BTAD domain-containing putative transcriptional regulator [Microtetraspora sp. NBRC 16547]GLX00527.1 SARP family transcriptional regulator [Microtetraspora sp. NBRC 16547]